MKKAVLAIAAGVIATLAANAADPEVSNLHVARATATDGAESLTIKARITTPAGLPAGREVILRPVVTSTDGTMSLELPAVTVAGRSRFIQAERLGHAEGYLRASRFLQHTYDIATPWQPWMEHSAIEFRMEERGCCGKPEGSGTLPAATIDLAPRRLETLPAFYVNPKTTAAAKTRAIEGSAFIDFPVNITEIRPAYRGNPAELARIDATIDSVASDADVTISAISIKGYASPEGSYANNTRLADGRTEALKRYVTRRHSFSPDIITTSFEPEDWEGLRRYVESSSLPHRAEILDIIATTSLEPDAREWRLKSRYPEEYRQLLADIYPALRHSDYRIEYVIRSFTDPAEILALAKTVPGKLSLNEFALAAATLPAGSPEWTALWATAARCFPQDEAAALNTAYGHAAAGDAAAALRAIDGLPDTPALLRARAAILATDGRLDEALATLAPLGNDPLAAELRTIASSTGITVNPALKP